MLTLLLQQWHILLYCIHACALVVLLIHCLTQAHVYALSSNVKEINASQIFRAYVAVTKTKDKSFCGMRKCLRKAWGNQDVAK